MSCESSFNCTKKGGIAKECIIYSSITEDEDFCDCAPIYGWQGSFCNRPSFQSIYMRAILIACIIWALVLIIRDCKLLVKAVTIWKHNIEGSYRIILLLLLAVTGLFLLLIGFALFLEHYFVSSGFIIVSVKGYQAVGKGSSLAAYYILYSSIIPHVSSVGYKISNWFSLLKGVGLDEDDTRKEAMLLKFSSCLTIFAIVVIPSMLLLRYFQEAFFVGILISLISLCVYRYMVNSFLKPLGDLFKNTEDKRTRTQMTFRDSYNFILFSNRTFFILGFLSFLCATIHLILVSDSENVRIQRRFSIIALAKSFFCIFSLCFQSFETWYTGRLINNLTCMDQTVATSEGTF